MHSGLNRFLRKSFSALLISPFIFAVFAQAAEPASVTVAINRVSADGVGDKVGTLTFTEGDHGLKIVPNIAGISPGPHGFHIHEKPSCDPAPKDGKASAAEAAGGHFDPAKTGKHLGPHAEGHRGDMPLLEANAQGLITKEVVAPNLRLFDIMNRSVVIHEGGDNYSDDPKPLGGGGVRWACGVIKP